jgi:hypothetical protein
MSFSIVQAVQQSRENEFTYQAPRTITDSDLANPIWQAVLEGYKADDLATRLVSSIVNCAIQQKRTIGRVTRDTLSDLVKVDPQFKRFKRRKNRRSNEGLDNTKFCEIKKALINCGIFKPRWIDNGRGTQTMFLEVIHPEVLALIGDVSVDAQLAEINAYYTRTNFKALPVRELPKAEKPQTKAQSKPEAAKKPIEAPFKAPKERGPNELPEGWNEHAYASILELAPLLREKGSDQKVSEAFRNIMSAHSMPMTENNQYVGDRLPDRELVINALNAILSERFTDSSGTYAFDGPISQRIMSACMRIYDKKSERREPIEKFIENDPLAKVMADGYKHIKMLSNDELMAELMAEESAEEQGHTGIIGQRSSSNQYLIDTIGDELTGFFSEADAEVAEHIANLKADEAVSSGCPAA